MDAIGKNEPTLLRCNKCSGRIRLHEVLTKDVVIDTYYCHQCGEVFTQEQLQQICIQQNKKTRGKL